jgi:hypothetical protein
MATAVLLKPLQQLATDRQVYPFTRLAIAAGVLLLTVAHQTQTVAYYLQHHTEAAYSVFSLKGFIVTGGEAHRYRYPAYSFWLSPMEFPKFPVIKADLDGMPGYTTPNGTSDLCGEAFPCAPYLNTIREFPAALKLRGKSVRDGFKIVFQEGSKP